MKKFFILLLLAGAVGLNSQSQTNSDARAILDKASSKLKASPGINASFSVTQKDKLNQVQGSGKGVIKIKGNKYYLKQDETQIFCNGVQTWNFDGHSEVTVSKVDMSDADDLSPQQILTGFSKEDFGANLISSAGTNFQVQIMPVDKRKNFKDVLVTINKSTNLLTKAVITDKAGNITEIVFSNINLTASIPDSEFIFDVSKHPGVEVVNQ